jgi:hypothetical protein
MVPGCQMTTEALLWIVNLVRHRPQRRQPLLQGAPKIVIGTTEGCVARCDELALFLAQRGGGLGVELRQDLPELLVDLTVELGQAGIAADRLLDRPLRRPAVEARLVVDGHHRAELFDLAHQQAAAGLRHLR